MEMPKFIDDLRKKAPAVALAATLALSGATLAGCGDNAGATSGNGGDNTPVAGQPNTPNTPSTSETPNQPSTGANMNPGTQTPEQNDGLPDPDSFIADIEKWGYSNTRYIGIWKSGQVGVRTVYAYECTKNSDGSIVYSLVYIHTDGTNRVYSGTSGVNPLDY